MSEIFLGVFPPHVEPGYREEPKGGGFGSRIERIQHAERKKRVVFVRKSANQRTAGSA